VVEEGALVKGDLPERSGGSLDERGGRWYEVRHPAVCDSRHRLTAGLPLSGKPQLARTHLSVVEWSLATR
jgi:hypothetical protein